MALQSMTALASITLQEASASVTFSGIPQNYRDLIIIANGKFTSSNSLIRIRVGNGSVDTGNNYSTIYAAGAAGNLISSEAYTEAYMTGGRWNNVEGIYTAQLIDYSATDKHKTVLVRNGSASFSATQMNAHRWSSTSAINVIQVLSTDNTFTAGSTFNLYGRIA
jgi:hypothetical protein